MSRIDELKNTGLKATLPRLKILEIFQQGKQRHMTAEDVFRVLLQDRSDVGLATVYRVLTQFEQAGILSRSHFESGKAVYEINEGQQPCRLLQIWIAPSRLGLSPSYEQKPFAIGAGWTPLLDPERRDGALAIARPVRLWRAQPAAGASLPLAIAAGSQGWIQLIEGAGAADGQPLRRGDGLGFAAGGLQSFTAGAAGAGAGA